MNKPPNLTAMGRTIRMKLLAQELTMADLAHECGWSRSYLYRVLREKKPADAVKKIRAATKKLTIREVPK